jgi:hypothetical protein
MSKIGDNLFRLVCEANRFQISEPIVDMERISDGRRLWHKRDMDAKRTATEEIVRKFAQAGIPRDGSMGVRKALAALRDAGITFSKAQVTKATLAEYCRRIPTFETLEIGTK